MKSAGNWSRKRSSFCVRPSPLGERHRTAVVPAIDHFGHALHPRTFGERRIVGDRVDVRFVDSQIIDQFGLSALAWSQTSVPATPGLASNSS